MTVVVPQVVGRADRPRGRTPFIVAGLSVHALAMLWIALVAEPGLAYWQVPIPLVLSGAGIAMSLPAAQSAVMSSVAPPDMGKASGSFSTMRQLGGAFGVAVFAGTGRYAPAQEFRDGFVAATIACAGLSLVGVLAGSVLPACRAPRQAAPAVPALEGKGS